MIAEERETVVNATDADAEVRIWTAQRAYIGKLRRHPKFTETRSGYVDGSEWAEFVIPRDQWNPASGAKRSTAMSSEQKAAVAERLARSRAPVPG
jgi:hypothetical protein